MNQSLFDNTYSLSTFKEQLKPLCYKNGKTIRSYQQFFRLYYFIRLLKYSTRDQLNSIGFSGSSKVATKEILKSLVELGHISTAGTSGNVFIPNETTDSIIRSVKYNNSRYFKIFAPLPKGIETSNDIKNTKVFIQAIKMKHYHFILFPGFDYVKPDALLVLKDNERYKLSFLEVETEQSNWSQRFEKMRDNYHRLAKDRIVYDYWLNTASQLNLAKPDMLDFCFSVIVVSDIDKDLGSGFTFRKNLNGI